MMERLYGADGDGDEDIHIQYSKMGHDEYVDSTTFCEQRCDCETHFSHCASLLLWNTKGAHATNRSDACKVVSCVSPIC
jgi:hypothetical protein